MGVHAWQLTGLQTEVGLVFCVPACTVDECVLRTFIVDSNPKLREFAFRCLAPRALRCTLKAAIHIIPPRT